MLKVLNFVYHHIGNLTYTDKLVNFRTDCRTHHMK